MILVVLGTGLSLTLPPVLIIKLRLTIFEGNLQGGKVPEYNIHLTAPHPFFPVTYRMAIRQVALPLFCQCSAMMMSADRRLLNLLSSTLYKILTLTAVLGFLLSTKKRILLRPLLFQNSLNITLVFRIPFFICLVMGTFQGRPPAPQKINSVPFLYRQAHRAPEESLTIPIIPDKGLLSRMAPLRSAIPLSRLLSAVWPNIYGPCQMPVLMKCASIMSLVMSVLEIIAAGRNQAPVAEFFLLLPTATPVTPACITTQT